MAHSISRTTAPIPQAGAGDAGPLNLEDTTHTEWDIVMTRDERWVTCRAGITDPDEVHQELTWFQLGNPSGSVTYRVLERTVSLRERLLEAPPDLPPDPGSQTTPADPAATAVAAGAHPGGTERPGSPAGPATTPRVTAHYADPATARCPSCRAAPGKPCKTPSGKPAAQPHRARGDAASQLYFDDVAQARQRGITVEELHARRAALRASRAAATAQRDAAGRP